jgi:hypothetical protein
MDILEKCLELLPTVGLEDLLQTLRMGIWNYLRELLFDFEL